MRTLLAILLLATSVQAQAVGGKAAIAGTTSIGGGNTGATIVVPKDYCSTSINTCDWNSGFAPLPGYGVAVLVWIPNGQTVTSVCDGNGVNQCTGTSNYTCEPLYSNSTNFISNVCYTCNYQGGTVGSLTAWVSTSGGSFAEFYVAFSFSGNHSVGCLDGYNRNQGIVNGTAYVSGSVGPTTNAGDLFVGFFTNNAGGTYISGTDGQGNTMTLAPCTSGASCVTGINYVQESTTNTFTAHMTGPNSTWNAEAIAFK